MERRHFERITRHLCSTKYEVVTVFIYIVCISYQGFRGKIHILSETHENANELADDIFLQYQKEAAKGDFLRRYALQAVSHHLLALRPAPY